MPTYISLLNWTEKGEANVRAGPGGGQEIPHLHIHLLGGGRLPGF